MDNWLSRVFFLVLGGLVLAGIVFAFWPEPVGVDLATVRVGALLVTVDEDGKTRIREKYVVSTPLSGKLLRVEMDPGDAVEANETLLAVVQPRDPELLDSRTTAQAEARVLSAEAAVRRAMPMLEHARHEANNAEAELGRVARASENGGATPSERDAAETRYRQATAAVRMAMHDQEIAEFELTQARSALLRSRPNGESAELISADEWNFDIRSPITGRVLRVFQESAAVVTAGTPLMELGAPSDLEVEIDVLSSDAVKIEAGDRVLLDRWGGERPLEGRVRLVEPAGFTKISTLGVEEQRVNVIVDLLDSPVERSPLGDGFRVEARIIVDEGTNALLAPTSALFRTSSEWAIFRVVDDIVQLTRVELGRRNDTFAEILSGLDENDTVVIHPSDRVVDGVRVRSR